MRDVTVRSVFYRYFTVYNRSCDLCICWHEFGNATSLQTRRRVCKLGVPGTHLQTTRFVCKRYGRVCKHDTCGFHLQTSASKGRVCKRDTARLQTRWLVTVRRFHRLRLQTNRVTARASARGTRGHRRSRWEYGGRHRSTAGAAPARAGSRPAAKVRERIRGPCVGHSTKSQMQFTKQ